MRRWLLSASASALLSMPTTAPPDDPAPSPPAPVFAPNRSPVVKIRPIERANVGEVVLLDGTPSVYHLFRWDRPNGLAFKSSGPVAAAVFDEPGSYTISGTAIGAVNNVPVEATGSVTIVVIARPAPVPPPNPEPNPPPGPTPVPPGPVVTPTMAGHVNVWVVTDKDTRTPGEAKLILDLAGNTTAMAAMDFDVRSKDRAVDAPELKTYRIDACLAKPDPTTGKAAGVPGVVYVDPKGVTWQEPLPAKADDVIARVKALKGGK